MKCQHCKIEFEARPRQVFCSKQCREQHWRIQNPHRWKEHQKRYRLSKKLICDYCKQEIPIQRRGRGVRMCSANCVKATRRQQQQTRRQYAQSQLDQVKLLLGCSRCGYNKCSRSLDFHHIDPTGKDMRITALQFVAMSARTKKELAKCVLVCKNCHGELHELMDTDSASYQSQIETSTKDFLGELLTNPILGGILYHVTEAETEQASSHEEQQEDWNRRFSRKKA